MRGKIIFTCPAFLLMVNMVFYYLFCRLSSQHLFYENQPVEKVLLLEWLFHHFHNGNRFVVLCAIYLQSESAQSEQQIVAETPAPQPVQDAAVDNTMVWQSATGSKYHSINNCGRMNPSKAQQITKTEAINRGLGQCSKCW